MARYEIIIKHEYGDQEESEIAKADTLSFTNNAKLREKNTVTNYLKSIKSNGLIKSSLMKVGVTGVVAAQAANTAHATFNFLTSQVGYTTGNYVLQERVDYGMNIAEKAANIALMTAISPILGATALVGEAVTQIINVAKTTNEMRVENTQKALERERIGISSSINRSREK